MNSCIFPQLSIRDRADVSIYCVLSWIWWTVCRTLTGSCISCIVVLCKWRLFAQSFLRSNMRSHHIGCFFPGRENINRRQILLQNIKFSLRDFKLVYPLHFKSIFSKWIWNIKNSHFIYIIVWNGRMYSWKSMIYKLLALAKVQKLSKLNILNNNVR